MSKAPTLPQRELETRLVVDLKTLMKPRLRLLADRDWMIREEAIKQLAAELAQGLSRSYEIRSRERPIGYRGWR